MQNGKRERYQPMKLDEARQLTPAVNPVEAMRKQLAMAAFDAVSEADVTAVTKKLKELALSGDKQAMKLFLELTGVMGKNAVPIQPADTGAAKVAEALRDLVDEIRISKAKAQREYDAIPNGTDD